MQAEILAIGSELLQHPGRDTNSSYLASALADLGIPVVRVTLLPDDPAAIAAEIGAAIARGSLILCTGGLGPTDDDRTRPAAATALNCRLLRDPEVVAGLEAFFAARGRRPAPGNFQQADRLESAEWLPNPAGTAPGQWARTTSAYLALLPGPPRELRPMFEREIVPRLRALAPQAALFTRVLHIVGVPESEVDAIAAPLYRATANPQTTILCTGWPQIELHFRASAASRGAAQALADELAGRIESLIVERFGDVVFSREGESLPAVIARLLTAHGQTLALAESCTGGLIAQRLTDIPGSSRFFCGGIVCYSNEVKKSLAGVREETLRAEGAVSRGCAIELADGVRERLAADWALSVTGIAGPDGGTAAKPVGTVFVGLSGPGRATAAFEFHLSGDRARIRGAAAQHALNVLRLGLTASEA